MKNKLGYLGYLGFIGLLGLVMGSFIHSVFLVFFFFFGYSQVIPDELFKENVKKSGFKAFVVNMVINFIIIIGFGVYTSVNQVQDLRLGILLTLALVFILNFVISLLTFIINLKYLDYKEQKILE